MESSRGGFGDLGLAILRWSKVGIGEGLGETNGQNWSEVELGRSRTSV